MASAVSSVSFFFFFFFFFIVCDLAFFSFVRPWKAVICGLNVSCVTLFTALIFVQLRCSSLVNYVLYILYV